MSANRKPKTINPDEIDPSVYYYDEVYDDMQQEREEQTETDSKQKIQQGSKYIHGIMETAERRKSERELRKFKKFAREREEAQASGDIDDNDVYVTKSYQKKLKEMQEVAKKHSGHDEDRTLNSFNLRTGVEKSHESGTTTSRLTKTTDQPDETCDAIKLDTDESELKSKTDDSERASSDLATKPKKILKTTEERRQYLREVLAKRTIGEVFKAAQARFRQRKAII
jgi:hypothetical protein